MNHIVYIPNNARDTSKNLTLLNKYKQVEFKCNFIRVDAANEVMWLNRLISTQTYPYQII